MLNKLRKRKRLIAIGLFILIAIAAIATYYISNKGSKDPLPESLSQKAGFTLYYSKKVPSEFKFDEYAYDSQTKVVTYDYSTADGKKIYFSLQPKPNNFNFDEFRNKQLTGWHEVSTSAGTATIGILQNQAVSSIVTDKTWIIISAGEKVSIDQLEEVSKGIATVK